MSHERIWRGVALLLVASLHLWLGWTWANQRPAPLFAALRPRIPSSETVLVLTFTARTNAAPRRSAPKAGLAARKLSARRTAGTLPVDASDLVSVAEQPAAAAPRLNLEIPPDIRSDAYHRGVLEHRQALESNATRFDRAWLSDGTLVDVAARRSRVAGVILGALGALTKPCTAKQRRDYDPACVPGQYVHRDEDDDMPD